MSGDEFGSESVRVGRLIERLLVDPVFRAEFRADPVGVCGGLGLEGLAAELGSGKAMYTLELRESRSSLAGVVMAVAAEGVGVAELRGLVGHGLHGEARAAALKALHGGGLKEPRGLRPRGEVGRLERVVERGGLAGGHGAPGVAGSDAPAAGGSGSGSGGSQAPAGGGSGQAASAAGGSVLVRAPAGSGWSGSAPAGGGSGQAAVAAPVSQASAAGGSGVSAGRWFGWSGWGVWLFRRRRVVLGGGWCGAGLGGGGSGQGGGVVQAPAGGGGGVLPEPSGGGGSGGVVAGVVSSGVGVGGGGSGVGLAELLASPRLSLPAGVRAVFAQGGVDPRLVSVLGSAVEHHSVVVGGLESVVDPVHAQSVNIVSVDGEPVGPGNVGARDLVTEIAALDPSVRPSEIGTPWPIQSQGFFSGPGQQARLHLAFVSQGDYQAPAGGGVGAAGAVVWRMRRWRRRGRSRPHPPLRAPHQAAAHMTSGNAPGQPAGQAALSARSARGRPKSAGRPGMPAAVDGITSAASAGAAVPGWTSSQSAVAAQLFKTFTGAGLSPAGASALIGNWMQESSLNPSEPGGFLAQWGGSRLSELTSQYGPNPSAAQQAQFALQELRGGYPSLLEQLKTTNDPRSAALAVSSQYERPNAALANNANREAQAAAALAAFGTTQGAPQTPAAQVADVAQSPAGAGAPARRLPDAAGVRDGHCPRGRCRRPPPALPAAPAGVGAAAAASDAPRTWPGRPAVRPAWARRAVQSIPAHSRRRSLTSHISIGTRSSSSRPCSRAPSRRCTRRAPGPVRPGRWPTLPARPPPGSTWPDGRGRRRSAAAGPGGRDRAGSGRGGRGAISGGGSISVSSSHLTAARRTSRRVWPS